MPTTMKRAFDDASGDVAEREGLVLPLEQREQHDGAADVGEDEDQLEERPHEHAGVAAGAEDVGGIAQHRAVGEHVAIEAMKVQDEEHAHGERGLPHRVHRDSFRCLVRTAMVMSVSIRWFGRGA